MSDGRQIVIEMIDQRNACRDVHGNDILSGELVQMHDQRPQAVAVSGDQYPLARSNSRGNGVGPIRFQPFLRIFQRLGQRKLLWADVVIPGIMPVVPGVGDA